MENHYKNLKEYVYLDKIYAYHQENPNKPLSDFEKYCISHIEDIRWALKEIDFLNSLVKEMSKKNENKVIKS